MLEFIRPVLHHHHHHHFNLSPLTYRNTSWFPQRSVSPAFGAFGRKHPAAVLTRIPRGSVFDSEIDLHPRSIECLHLVCLQGVRNGTREFHIVYRIDGRRPKCLLGENWLQSSGQHERWGWTQTSCAAFRRMEIHTDNMNQNDVETFGGVQCANSDDEDGVIFVWPLQLFVDYAAIFASMYKTLGAWRFLGDKGAAGDIEVTALTNHFLAG